MIRTQRAADAALLVTVFVVLLLAIPAPMVIPPLGTAGSPATVLAMMAFCLWLWFQLQRDRRTAQVSQPVRAAMIGWLLIMVAVYAHAMAHPISSDEISPADSGLLRLIGMTGIVLVTNDGLRSLARHRQLAGRIVVAVGIVAVLALFQTMTKQLWVDRIAIPGLRSGAAGWALAGRSGLVRPSGTATHPIELGMVLTTVLPLAMTMARSAPRRRWMYRAFLLAIAVAILLSISRSAMICAAVAFVATILTWPLTSKLRAFGSVVVVLALVFVTRPGVLGTITNLFTGISNDSSVASRTGSYEVAGAFIERSPWLGRGFGTFLPKYWILDNGYLGLLDRGGLHRPRRPAHGHRCRCDRVTACRAAPCPARARRRRPGRPTRLGPHSVHLRGRRWTRVLRHLRLPAVRRNLLPAHRNGGRVMEARQSRAATQSHPADGAEAAGPQ